MDTNPDPATLEKAMDARKSVVTVFVEKKRTDDGSVIDGYGSGFVIKSSGGKGIVITCEHVLRGSEEGGFDKKKDKIFVRGMGDEKSGGIPWQAQGHLIRKNPFGDLTIVKVTGMPKNAQALKFVPSDDLPVGTSVVAVGYSNPDDVFCDTDEIILTTVPAVSPGTISGHTMVSQESDVVKEEVPLSCETETGFSGCPVLCRGGVFGAITCGFEQISLAISTETIQRMFKKWLHIVDDEGITIEDMLFI